MDQVEGKAVVIVDQQDHGVMSSLSALKKTAS
jgi:hypothetical protein